MTMRHIDRNMRLRLHLLPLVAVLFLSFYGKAVCPLLDELSLTRVVSGLGGVCLLQILLRELSWYVFPVSRHHVSLARHAFRLSVTTWILTGMAAVITHSILYPDFPMGSHLKLVSGYWGLGAGILSQLEYVILEYYFRRTSPDLAALVPERIAVRLMEGFTLFTLVPVLIMVLMSFRFVLEGYTDQDTALEVLFLGCSFVLVSLSVSWLYGRTLHQDCENLLDAVHKIAAGAFQIHVDPSRGDELGRVAMGINDMAQGLLLRERIREAFGRFVNPQVAETFINQFARDDKVVRMGGERREVTILMADLRDFTPRAERMDPEALTLLLNGYFTAMVKAIQAHGGMVDKFIGDAIMAVFGLDVSDRDHTVAALAAALDMRKNLLQFNRERPDDPVNNGIGIHRGEVVAGYFGTPDRLEFTVVGHAVNLAARIESQAKSPHPPLLFSALVADRVRHLYPVREVTTASLKGVSEEVVLYTVTE
ncbi:MAG: HAMP domain-containing protein [Magnetococcus sp. DMHC-1]|nr:HAMP domain-containing protein [Magnetococcales bacterium]